jgi:hypothetical protein
MKRFSFLVMALIMLFVSCETYEEQNARLTYEVKEVVSADLVDKNTASLVGVVTGGLGGLIVANVATDTLDKLQVTDNIVKTEKYVLAIRAIGDTENPIVLGTYGITLECEGVKKTWQVGDLVETEQAVHVKKNNKGEYKVSQFNSAKTTYFHIKTKYK